MRKTGKWLFGCTMVGLWFLILVVGSCSFGFFLHRLTAQNFSLKKEYPTHQSPTPTPVNQQTKDATVLQLSQIIQGNFSTSGQVEVAVTYTSNQIEEMIETLAIPATEEVQVSCDEQGEMVLQFKLGKDTSKLLSWIPSLQDYQGLLALAQGSQVKIKADIDWQQQNKLSLKLNSITLAGVAIPFSLVQTANQSIDKSVTKLLDKMEGLEVKKLEFHTDSITFEGKVPQSITLQ